MKIFLEAFVDNNFGDNLFVHIVTARYPEHTFYMLAKDGFEESFRLLSEHIENVCLVEEQDKASFLKQMDAMFIVGGDMFGDKADYSVLMKQIRTIKKKGGIIAFLGISLFKHYSKMTWLDLQMLFSQADIIVVRESTTYQQLKKKVPWANIVASADMAFSTDVTELKKTEPQKGVLGISVRKKVQADWEVHYSKYCGEIAKNVLSYLEESKEHRVKLLAFSSGRFDDRMVAEDIIALCPDGYKDRIDCVSFLGNVSDYMLEIQRCEKLLCTRFHALAFALLLKKPFVPIIYEDKMERLLDEIEYDGMRTYYEGEMEPKKVLRGFADDAYSESQWEKYQEKVNYFFGELDEKLMAKKINICGAIWDSVLYNIYVVKEFVLNKIYRKYFKKHLK